MIYLDNNASTFTDPCVIRAMNEILSGEIGNPSSIHMHGQKAKSIFLTATREIADYFGVHPHEVIFTSGATEAINTLLYSIPIGGHLITSSLEHPALLAAAGAIEKGGCEVTYLDPLPMKGAITAKQVENALRSNTSMIALMAVNNETGIKTDLEGIASIAQEVGVPFVVDAVAMLGKEKWTLQPGVAAACFSGHKVHASTGVGVLIARRRLKLSPLIVGGAQQQGKRGGTENLTGIVGFAKALSLIDKRDFARMERLRNRLEEGLQDRLKDIMIHGIDQSRICNTSNISFLGVDGETLLMSLDLAGISVSHGSACSSGSLEPSRVLINMGMSQEIARRAIRFSLSRFTTKEEIETTIQIVSDIVLKIRTLAT